MNDDQEGLNVFHAVVAGVTLACLAVIGVGGVWLLGQGLFTFFRGY